MFASGLIFVSGTWVWKYSFSGCYTVKSGYMMAYRWRRSKEAGLGESSNWADKEVIWRRLWSAKSSKGMKLLFWRVFYNAIPVRLNLVKRGVESSLECTICGFAIESSDHLFLGCWWARHLWEALGVETSSVTEDSRLGDWLWRALTLGNRDMVSKIIIGLHMVWGNKNQVSHGKKPWSIAMCVFKAKCLFSEFAQRQLIGYSEATVYGSCAEKGWKVYCDGSWSWRARSGGWAAVVCKEGVYTECKTEYAVNGVTGFETEVNAIVLGLEMAEKIGCGKLEILSDCVNAIWVLQSGWGPVGIHIGRLEKGRKLLKDWPGWELKHIRRVENCMADALASKARRERWTWDCAEAFPLVQYGLQDSRPGATDL